MNHLVERLAIEHNNTIMSKKY